jgi:uncharacterized protein (TIGR01777 family)
MPSVTFRSPMPVPADALAAWHFRPGAFQRLTPPWERADVVAATGPFADGTRWTIRTTLFGPVTADVVAELSDVRPGEGFRDRMVRGPFADWRHTHRFLPDGPDRSVLEDHIEYRLPLGALGRLAGGRTVRRRLDRMFAYRHAVTAGDLRRHARFPGRSLTVAVTGSRGLIGSALVPFLTAGGHRVVRLVTGGAKSPGADDGTTWTPWDPTAPLPPAALAGVDAVIHLAGDNIAGSRWTRAKRRRLRESRVGPTRRVAEAAAAAGVRVFVGGSAVGIYGDRGDEELTEASPPGTGFLADLCREWEEAAEPAAAAGARVVNLRTGIVLSPRGGALAKQLPAFRLGGGAVLGGGRQWVSWVGLGDAVGAIHHALMTDAVRGPVNVVAPEPVTNREFAKTLGTVLGRPVLLTVPGPALRLAVGRMADEALLAGQRVRPRALEASGFACDRPGLEAELRFALGR